MDDEQRAVALIAELEKLYYTPGWRKIPEKRKREAEIKVELDAIYSKAMKKRKG